MQSFNCMVILISMIVGILSSAVMISQLMTSILICCLLTRFTIFCSVNSLSRGQSAGEEKGLSSISRSLILFCH